MNNYQLVKNTEWKEVEVNGEDKEIPIYWEVSTFEKEFTRWVDHRGISPEKVKDNTAIPLLTTKVVKLGYLGTPTEYITSTDYEKRSKRGFLQKNDLIFTTEAPAGNVAIFKSNEKIALGQRMIALSSKGNNEYFKYLLMANYFRDIMNKISNGSTAQGITTKVLKGINVFYPPLSQQYSIASILSAQESIISDIESLISKYEFRFQYLSEELLCGRLRVKEIDGQNILYKNADDNWKEVEVNGEVKEIPIDWGVANIGTNIKLNMGNTPKKESDNYSGDLPWITISNLNTKFISNYTALIKKAKNIRIFLKGTLIGSFKMSVGKFAFLTEPSAINEAIIGIQPNIYNNLDYLYYVLPQIFIENAEPNGQGLLLLNQEKIKNLAYLNPDMQEQNLIAKVLTQHDILVEKQKDFLIKEKQKFDWLLDNLLSGKYLVKG